MKPAIIICLLGALAAAALSLKLGWPNDAQQRYYRAHNEVERITFGKDGSDELKKAVTAERAAEKDLFVIRDLGRRLVLISAGFSTVALFIVAFARRESKKPNKSPAHKAGAGPATSGEATPSHRASSSEGTA